VNFDQAFTTLVDPQHEGGYCNLVGDSGGETYKGISRNNNQSWAGWALVDGHKVDHNVFPLNLDTDAALQALVKDFYRANYWTPAGCESVPDLVRYELFDLAVNTSAPGRPTTAIKLLQKAVGVTPDGAFGPQTAMRCAALDANVLFRRFVAAAIRYYTAIPAERRDRFLAGWMNRLATNLENA
jgi:lysozyme family protein